MRKNISEILALSAHKSVARAAVIALPLLFPAISNAEMTEAEFEAKASENFNLSHKAVSSPPAEADRQFEANFAFPTTLADASTMRWADIHPVLEPREYMQAVFEQAYEDCNEKDWGGKAGSQCNWFHAPWMHGARDYMRGMTKERRSRPGELHPNQIELKGNYAVGFYNNIAGFTFAKMWADPARPKTKDLSFAEGAASIKLLFTTATVEEVPYLRNSLEWKMLIGDTVETVRLLQMDIAVKDSRVNNYTGWVLGTFMYNGSFALERCRPDPACEKKRWHERMIPVGLQWGNDPLLGPTAYADGARPKEAWINPDVTTMFTAIRGVGGHPDNLGRLGRMNGPIDNPQSSCMSCHGQALDFGRYVPFFEKAKIMPFAPAWNANDAQLARFFRNLKSDEPFVEGTQSLDYSLQAALGIQQFRRWVSTLDISDDLKAQTRDIPEYPRSGAEAVGSDVFRGAELFEDTLFTRE